MKQTSVLHIGWQDYASQNWLPVAQLWRQDATYCFAYCAGALEAGRLGNFRPIEAFPSFDDMYVSDRLFPFFQNRILASSRPERGAYFDWLALDLKSASDIEILARSGGRRATDHYDTFPDPEILPSGNIRTQFFGPELPHHISTLLLPYCVSPRIETLATNHPPAPKEFRYRCAFEAQWTGPAEPFSGPLFELLVPVHSQAA